MDLTPRDIHDRRFHDAFRGYNQEEVDLFLDEVAASFEKVFRENQTFHHRLKDLESQLSEARATEDMLKQMLVAAQKTANEAVETARAQAEELLAQAQARGSGIVAEAEGRAAEILNQALARQREAAATIESLRAFDRQHRERLRSFMESQVRALGELTVFSPPPEEPVFGVETTTNPAGSTGSPGDGPADATSEIEPEPSAAAQMPATPEPAEAAVSPGAGGEAQTTVAGSVVEGGIQAPSDETEAYAAISEEPGLAVVHPAASAPLPEATEAPPASEEPGPKPEQDKDEDLSIDELFWGERKR